MSLLKRLSATLVSRLDQVVGEIENHDAVIQVSLNDMRKKVAETRVRLTQLQRERERLQRDANEQQQLAERWRLRAMESASSDEKKALECVRRARHCDQQSTRLAEAGIQYAQTADRLVRDIDASEQRLRELKQKHTLMRARQSSSSAANMTCESESDVLRQLDNSCDRWEIKLSQLDMVVDHLDPVDSLERDFISHEQELELREELATLLTREKN